MIQEADLTKLYYSIGEVAEMFQVNTSLIRFWEKEFPSIKPKKNQRGNRKFTPADIMELQRIYYLVRTKGFTLDGARMALKDKNLSIEEPSTQDNQEIIRRLENIKQKLLALK